LPRAALRAIAGFLAGLAIWTFASPLYDRFLAAAAEAAMRVVERPEITRLNAQGNLVSVDRIDFSPTSKHPAIPVDDLTFNFLLVTALFAASPRPFSDRNIGGFLAACAVLAVTHVFGLIAEVMSIYVLKLGAWSYAHYSDWSRNFWGVANHAYRLVLMYAIGFAVWWAFRPTGEQRAAGSGRGPARRKPQAARRVR
jgi:hypothetical protein